MVLHQTTTVCAGPCPPQHPNQPPTSRCCLNHATLARECVSVRKYFLRRSPSRNEVNWMSSWMNDTTRPAYNILLTIRCFEGRKDEAVTFVARESGAKKLAKKVNTRRYGIGFDGNLNWLARKPLLISLANHHDVLVGQNELLFETVRECNC